MANLRKVRDGKYRVDWRDQKGNRYRKTFERKKDADDHLAAIKVDMKAGTYVAPKVVPTLHEVADQWFANDVDFDAGTIHFRRSLSWAKLPGGTRSC